MSKEEDVLYNYLRDRLGLRDGDIIRNWRPNKLKNQKTGHNLEIDIYIGYFPIGFEYQGGVHFRDIKLFNNDSDKSRYNDIIKHEIIMSSPRGFNIMIIEVFESDILGDIYNNILERIINTRNYYIMKQFYNRALKIEQFRIYYINRFDIHNHRLSWVRGIIWQRKPQLPLEGLDYKMFRILLAFNMFKLRCKGRSLREYNFYRLRNNAQNWLSPFIDDDYNFRENIGTEIINNTDQLGNYNGR